jgi:hypothetical protein
MNSACIQINPPEEFDHRSWEHWTVYELMAIIEQLGELAQNATGDERERLLSRESDAFRCLGWLSMLMAPPPELMVEWNEAGKEAGAAEPLSMESVYVGTRIAEIQRACGAAVCHYGRDYMYGDEPIP